MPRNHRLVERRRRTPEQIERRAARRAELLEAADRVIRRRGPTTSMTEIAAEAGVTKPILYKHFGDKGGLYQALAERYVSSLMTELRVALAAEAEPEKRIRSTIETYLAFIESDPQVYRFLMHRAVGERPEAQATVADFIGQLSREIALVLGEELRRMGADSGGAEPWANGIVGMVQLAGDRWLEKPTMTRASLVDYLSALLWLGFSRLPTAGEETEAS
jgi:AcrR family transcriptional regulator